MWDTLYNLDAEIGSGMNLKKATDRTDATILFQDLPKIIDKVTSQCLTLRKKNFNCITDNDTNTLPVPSEVAPW